MSGKYEGLKRGKVRLLVKQGGSGIHPLRDQKLLDGSEKIVKLPGGLQTLRNTQEKPLWWRSFPIGPLEPRVIARGACFRALARKHLSNRRLT